MDTIIERPIEIQREFDLTRIKTKLIVKTELSVDFENHTWVTAYGLEIPVREMSTNHINNCIRCFNGMGNMRIPEDYLGGKAKWLGIFQRELLNRN